MVHQNPNDFIRDAILRELYQIHSKAKSPKSAATGIKALQASLKKAHGFKQQEVGSNLSYLVMKGWVIADEEQRSFTTPKGTTQSATKMTYKISDKGVDHLESASVFARTPKHSTVNITTISGVTVVGDGNVVNTSFVEVAKQLSELRDAIETVEGISPDDKLDALADIETIQAQLQKASPNPGVVAAAWESVKSVATVGGFLAACERIAEGLAPFLLA